MFDDNMWHSLDEAKALDALVTMVIQYATEYHRDEIMHICGTATVIRSVNVALDVLRRVDLIEEYSVKSEFLPLTWFTYERINKDRLLQLDQYIREGGRGPTTG